MHIYGIVTHVLWAYTSTRMPITIILLYQINHLKQLQQRTGQSQRSGTQTMPQHVFCCMLPDYLYEYDTVESMEECIVGHYKSNQENA